MKGPILVCFAVKEEAAFFKPPDPLRSLVRVLVTGMGRRNTEREIKKWLEEQRPCAVFSCGFAGGLRTDLGSGTVVFEAEAGSILEKALTTAVAVPGRFYCADRVASTCAEKRELARTTGADAVEMESQWIREICRTEGLPVATVRVILDTLEQDLPLDFNLLMNENHELELRKLMLTLAKRPGIVPRLLQFRRQTQSAARKLGEVLEKAVERVWRELVHS